MESEAIISTLTEHDPHMNTNLLYGI